jgi:peptidylprolyl isomerase
MAAMRGLLLTIALCAALAIAGCGSSDSSSSSSSSSGESSESSSAIKWSPPGKFGTEPEVVAPGGTPPTKLETKDLITGSGAAAKAGDEISVQYSGANFKTGEEFDSSWSRNAEPFSFNLGGGEVIAGWDQGIVGMKVGGRRELIIPPELGYGPAGSPPVIPPNETLVFVVDLLAVK